MDVLSILDPGLFVLFGASGATIWFAAAARRRQASALLTAVGALGFFCGSLIAALGATHSVAVIGVALRRSPFEYDFRFYSLVLLGALLVAGGLRCLASAWTLTQGDSHAWRAELRATAALLAINVPLMPIQGFAVGFSAFLTLNLLALLLTRERFSRATDAPRTQIGALDAAQAG